MSDTTFFRKPGGKSVAAKRHVWGLSRFWWMVLLFWLLVSLASGLEMSFLHTFGRTQVLMEALARLLIWVFMTLLVVWISSTFTLERGSWKRVIWVYIAACVLCLFVVGLVSYFGVPPLIASSKDEHVSLTLSVLLRLTNQMPIFWGLVAVAHAVRLYEREQFQKLREAELRARLAQSRLDMLQLQLNPHFLFNTLNSIASLVHENPATAEQMIEALSNLLRMALTSTGRQLVTLREELHLLDQFILIERIRFEDRLQIDMQIDESLLEDKVPMLILQPLVENAVKHGIESHIAPGVIEISAQTAGGGNFLRLEVGNSGPVLDSIIGKIQERVGLTNTRARLREIFATRASLELHPRPNGGVIARILIPRGYSGELRHAAELETAS
jgi:sensor histidine kinase YesM